LPDREPHANALFANMEKIVTDVHETSKEDKRMIRAAQPPDTPTLVTLTEATGMFKPHEVVALKEVLTDYFAYNHEHNHHCVINERHGEIMGYAYYAPAAMTDRTWYLYWIAVNKATQARGIGGELLQHVEQAIKEGNGRVLFIETSGLTYYDLTRKFYLKHHYEVTGVLKDYYSDGDDMVVFRKKLQ
jgi:ribosomal protein S18 acetylase RimI-like enzyme